LINKTTIKSDPPHGSASFADWIDGRQLPHFSTNAGATRLAFQNWRRFKEAFAPELIGQAFEETTAQLGRTVSNALDPFGGSGTTALACQFLGVHPTTIEVNPYLADLIEAKLSTYDIDALIEAFREVMSGDVRTIDVAFPGAPATFVEPGVDGKFIFSREVAARLADLRERIERVGDRAARRLMLVLVGSIALDVSHVVVSGKGRRYRRRWTERPVDPARVDAEFADAVIRAIYEIQRYRDRCEPGYDLLRGDARELLRLDRQFDMAVFSPPYPNSFDYTDVYNVELWVCGYLTGDADNRALRMSTLRSHVQISRDFEFEGVDTPTLRETTEALASIRKQLWNPHIPEMVGAYFADMAAIFDQLSAVIRSGGRTYLVVGDSRYANIDVPVAVVLKELALQRGFRIAASEPFRSMRASPQQGGRQELVETLLTLTRE
jgi:hypothetical protein